MLDVGARRAEDRQGLHRRATSRSWRRSARSTPTTCRWSARTGRWTSTTATCGRSTPQGKKIFDQVDYQKYLDYIAEEVRPWSYMKFPFIKSLGPENGWYRVGPLARVNTSDFIDTPEAEAARKEFMAVTNGKPNNITMAYHWARMIELLHSIEKIRRCCTTRTCRARTWWSRASGARKASA